MQKTQLLIALSGSDEYIDSEVRSQDCDSFNVRIRADSKARANISVNFSDYRSEHVRDCTTAKKTWLAILNVSERHKLFSKLAAGRDIYIVQCTPSQSMMQIVSCVKALAAGLEAKGVVIDDKKMALAVLIGLPTCFYSLIVALDALGSEQKDFCPDYVRIRMTR